MHNWIPWRFVRGSAVTLERIATLDELLCGAKGHYLIRDLGIVIKAIPTETTLPNIDVRRQQFQIK